MSILQQQWYTVQIVIAAVPSQPGSDFVRREAQIAPGDEVRGFLVEVEQFKPAQGRVVGARVIRESQAIDPARRRVGDVVVLVVAGEVRP